MSKSTSPSDIEPGEPQVYRKPRADVYTLLLSIALIALIVGSFALWMVMGDYKKEIKGGPQPTWNLPVAPAVFDAPRGVA